MINLMEDNGSYRASTSEIDRLKERVLIKNKEGKYASNKKYVGKNAGYILNECGINTNVDYKVIIAEVPNEHPFVSTEMLMPVLPIVIVDSLEEAIDKAIKAKTGASIPQSCILKMSESDRSSPGLDTTIFVKNAPSYAGLGIEGEGYTTLQLQLLQGRPYFSQEFHKIRRCTLSGSFRII